MIKTEEQTLFVIDSKDMPLATEGAMPIENAVLAMAYVPVQKFANLYSDSKGLQAGTMFADLDKPFCGKGVKS